MPGEPTNPDQEAARLYEETEAATARAMETLVASGGFSALLVGMAENVAAVTRLGADTMDLVLRNLRLASRRDIVRLGRQLARTEDKLERVLQEVEGLRAELSAPAKRERAVAEPQAGGAMNVTERIRRTPGAAVEFANVILTTPDAAIGRTPRDVVWTHRQTTLYRYRSTSRSHAVPVLLVFALINRPEIFDLRPGNSFVEFLLDEGYDVFLVDWGEPDEEDADMGLAEFVCDELHWAVRETLRAPARTS